jgi:ankyrin repeat protein
VKILLHAKADVNKADRNDWTPLHDASYNGHVDCVKVCCFVCCECFLIVFLLQLLIAHGANINARNIGRYSPLHMAAANGHLACVEVCVNVVEIVCCLLLTLSSTATHPSWCRVGRTRQ